MSSNRWLTKEDIINDLAKVTGSRATNIDDIFAVRGERPPPVIVPDEEEDEFVKMNKEYAIRSWSIAEPDLCGITHMLRMVNEYYDSATYDDNMNIKELKKAADTVISISKLNPNVPEFIPKNEGNIDNETDVVKREDFSTSELPDQLDISESCSGRIDNEYVVCKDRKEIYKTDASHKNVTNNDDIDFTKKIDVSSLNSSGIKDITDKLKQKIVPASKTECLKKKRERNLAMASLQRLYTDIPKSPNNDPPLKLMTPEYFQTVLEDESNNPVGSVGEQNIKDEIKIVDKQVQNTKDLSREASPSSLKVPATSQDSSELSSKITSDAEIDKQNNDLLMAKEIEESVKKVDKWLNGPEKKKHKSRAAYFGAVTFKRKDTRSVNSSETQSLSIADNGERPSSTQTSDSFVPSPYANKLTETYMERSQSKEIQNETIWSKLERQLQERDKAIKERLLATQAQK